MFPLKAKSIAEVDSKTYPLGEKIEQPAEAASLALVALSHTPVERRLYAAMLAATNGSAHQPGENQPIFFTVRTLMDLTVVVSLSTGRLGLEGLVSRFIIEC